MLIVEYRCDDAAEKKLKRQRGEEEQGDELRDSRCHNRVCKLIGNYKPLLHEAITMAKKKNYKIFVRA